MAARILIALALATPIPATAAASEPDAGAQGGGDDDWGDFDEDFGEPSRGDGGDGEAGLSVDLHGSFENQLTGFWLRLYNGGDRVALHDYTRLRVDLDANLPRGIQVRSDAIARVFVGESELHVANLVPREAVDRLVDADPRWAWILEEKWALENELYLDNAYLKIPISRALVTIGKQPLEQGAGYAFNPTDVFTTKDMFDPTYEKPGVVALRVLVPLGSIASIDLVGAPDGELEEWTAGGRASIRLGPVSLSAASYVTRLELSHLEESIDAVSAAAAAGGDPGSAVIETDSRRVMVGGDAILDVAGVRIWAEGAYDFVDGDDLAPDDWWELAAGVEYFFPFETHVMVEYFHYGLGPEQRGGSYRFGDWMSVLSGDLKVLGRDFLMESVDHPVADFWTLGLSSFQSVSDLSAAIMADARWEFAQDAELWLLVAGNVGEAEDFLSSARGQAWLRVKVHF